MAGVHWARMMRDWDPLTQASWFLSAPSSVVIVRLLRWDRLLFGCVYHTLAAGEATGMGGG